MITNPKVKLTKYYYYDAAVPTISKEVYQNEFNSNIIIKKTLSGQKLVLNVNKTDIKHSKKSKKHFLFATVLACIVFALIFGILNSFEGRFLLHISQSNKINNTETVLISKNKTTSVNVQVEYCQNCSKGEVCLKLLEIDKPKCIRALEPEDPTGCGGHCKMEIEYCKGLDSEKKAHQCLPDRTRLQCPENSFNCGDLCINKENRCDGAIHCPNQSDEMNCVTSCNLTNQFLCDRNATCLDKGKKCNGIVDCFDVTDELDCNKSRKCQGFLCLNGLCIEKFQFCDGILQCSDGTDEMYCDNNKI